MKIRLILDMFVSCNGPSMVISKPRGHGSSGFTTSYCLQVFLLVYVDDIIMMGRNATLVSTLLGRLASAFKIQDLGKPGFFFGIETIEASDGMILSQRHYMTDLLNRYRRIVGALQYLTITWPDLSYAVNRLCQFMHSPSTDHWAMVKRVLRYIKGTLDYGLRLSSSPTASFHAYSDSDWAGCSIDRKSTSGHVVFLGSNLISWLSRKQGIVARSSTEAEYKALANFAAKVTWVVSLLRELGLHTGQPSNLWCDNLGATYLCAKPVFHARTKHVEIDYHFIRDKVATGEFLVNFVSTKDQLADVFTKPLPGPRFAALRDKLNVVSHQPCT
ncbi:PREDICTED: uncharacterized protein LOC109154206 [Ipomoea nil]|uniref:uncharacterized protein LOC109154206 n=1 Tax=Ipomoea nil TaxID=35883 RepID=UPI000900B9D2|nr:PREDICTED: uncharacterized protein LOC109154206 [Ipomoea nil]